MVVENGVPGHNFKFIQVVVSFRRRRHKREEEKRHLFHHQGTSADAAQDRVEETPIALLSVILNLKNLADVIPRNPTDL